MANMTFKANLLPDNASGQKELGSSTKKWKIYAEEIDVTGDAHLHNETYADSITVGDLVVTGSTNLKTSDIVNDSGFITVNDIPEGAAASTTTPKMDGTAAAGTELAFARGDHVHPSDTTKVDKVTGKGLSTNDYTNSEKTKLSGIATGAQVNVLEGIQKNGTAVTITNKVANITVPTKTSDITNDSGFITAADVPAGIQPTTTTPKMDGTAAIGTETQYAKGDHVHPSDTTKVDKISGKGLSTNDFTTALKNKLEGISAGAEVNVQSDWNQTTTSADDYIKNKPSIPTKVSDLTNDSGYITSADVPEGASASVTDPLMDGTAATGTSTAFARGDHVHPTDTSRAASDHTHGNITNDGDITATAPTIANGDQLIINDHSKSKITNGPTFDGTTTTKALTPKGTWETFNNYSLPLAADGTRGGIQIGYTQSGQNYPIQLSSEKAYVNVPWTDTKVTQAYSTTNDSYPLLLSATNGVTSTGTRGATTSILNNSFYANPNTGTLSTKNLIITDTSSTARIEFSRTGGANAPNYIQFPANSRLNFVGGATRGTAVSMMILDSTEGNLSIFPGTTDQVNLGTTSNKWSNVYATTFNGALSGNASTATKWASAQKVYVTLGTASTTTTIQGGSTSAQTIGVNGTLPVANGGTGNNTQIASRMCYTNSSGNIKSGNHYVDDTHVAIGSTTAPSTTFHVGGTASISSSLTLTGTSATTAHIAFSRTGSSYFNYITVPSDSNLAIGSDTNGTSTWYRMNSSAFFPAQGETYNLGTSGMKWKSVYADNFSDVVRSVRITGSNSSGTGFYLSQRDTENTHISNYFIAQASTLGTTTTTGITNLYIGNSKKGKLSDDTDAEVGNAKGRIRLYGADSAYHRIESDLTEDNAYADGDAYYRSVHFQNYAGGQYLIHGGSSSAIGSTSIPVYIAENGRATACSGLDSKYVLKAGDTMAGGLYHATSTSSAFNSKGVLFGTGEGRLGYNSEQNLLGIYSIGKIYIRPDGPADLSEGGSNGMILSADAIEPGTSGAVTLGSTSKKWEKVFGTPVLRGSGIDYGTITQMNNIENPVAGQLFFVLV